MIEFTLPFPPSVNNLFAGKFRRYPSKRYRAWKSAAQQCVMMQRRGQPVAPDQVTVTIALTAPDKRRRDADNLAKPVIDCLVSMAVLRVDDQHQVRRVTTEWSNEPGTPGARVRITPAG